MTSSTKPEVRNVSQRRQRRTEPRLQATCIKLAKFGLVVFQLWEQTDRHTDSHYFIALQAAKQQWLYITSTLNITSLYLVDHELRWVRRGHLSPITYRQTPYKTVQQISL